MEMTLMSAPRRKWRRVRRVSGGFVWAPLPSNKDEAKRFTAIDEAARAWIARAASGRADAAKTDSVHDGPVPPQAADAQTPPNEHTKGDH
jgi:hypothetical protein